MSEPKLNRRAFLKALAAGGVSATIMPAFAHAAPVSVPLAVDEPKGMKAVFVHTEGPMGNLGWKNGDTLAWLPKVDIPDGPAADTFAKLGKDKIKDIYWKMFANYRWETSIKDQVLEGKNAIGSGHMYIGEEAISTGVMASLGDKDLIASTHRGHGHLIAKGGDLNAMMAEFHAKVEGYNKGFGGSMHLTDLSKGILGMNGIVGAGWFITAGSALASKIRGEKVVSVAFAGDGASNNVWFFSAVRNAVNYKLPAVFIIENNFYNISVPGAAVVPTKRIADYCVGLGIPCKVVDGNDVTAVYQVASEAIARARAGDGPSVIEAQTFRWYDHSGFAGAKLGQDGAFGLPYRSDDEVKQWMAVAPWVRLGAWAQKKGILTKDEIAAIEKDVQAKVDASVVFALKGAYPKPDAGLEHVYSKGKVIPRQFLDGVVPAEFKVQATDPAEFKRQVAMYEQTTTYLS